MDSVKNYPINQTVNAPVNPVEPINKTIKKTKKRVQDKLSFNTRTAGEEIGCAISHGAASLTFLAGTILMIVRCVSLGKSPLTVFAVAAFGFGFLAVQPPGRQLQQRRRHNRASFLYHTVTDLKVKKTLQVLDHCMIYVMICGSYAPVCLGMIKGVWGWAIWGVNVACMILGIVINLVDIHKFYRLSQALYILMGWMIVVGAVQMIRAIPLSGLLYLVAGGLLYTFGIIFYKMKDKKYMHLVFHLFVIAGSIPHFLFVLFYICR